MTTPMVSVVGWHNVGKTTFIEELVAELKRRGYCVATVKHSREGFEFDHPGTDTWRYARAGSDVVAISGRSQMAYLERTMEELTLSEVIGRLPGDLDIILLEGFKLAPVPKLEVVRAGAEEGRIARAGELLALVGDEDLSVGEGMLRFGIHDAAAVVDLLEKRGLVRQSRARKRER